MFERGRIDNTQRSQNPTPVPVELELLDGSEAKGKLMVPAGQAPLDAINTTGCFAEFVPYTGEPRLLAKSTIASIRLVGVPQPRSLAPRGGPAGDFDPHAVLGVTHDASWEEVRAAYVQLSKTYHPDRYSSAALPAEVGDYLETMARRINAAYAALETTERSARRYRADLRPAVYASTPRG
jgi:DnaJ-domain-containing protein 1